MLNQKAIKNYNDFVSALLEAGFSMGGGNSDDVFSLMLKIFYYDYSIIHVMCPRFLLCHNVVFW